MKNMKNGKKIPIDLLVVYFGRRNLPTIPLNRVILNQLPRSIMASCVTHRWTDKNDTFFKDHIRKLVIICHRTLERGYIGIRTDYSLFGCSTAVFNKDGVRKDPKSAYVYHKWGTYP